MKPIRMTILAALTAAIAIAPLASAEAHKRHKRHGGDVAAAIALGLLAAGVASRTHRHRHHYRGNCYGLPRLRYNACMNGHYYGWVAPHYDRHYWHRGHPNRHGGYHYRHGGLQNRHLDKNAR